MLPRHRTPQQQPAKRNLRAATVSTVESKRAGTGANAQRTVKGMANEPMMACKNPDVRVVGVANMLSVPLQPEHTPTRAICRCEKSVLLAFSLSVNIMAPANMPPKSMANKVDTSVATKYGSLPGDRDERSSTYSGIDTVDAAPAWKH